MADFLLIEQLSEVWKKYVETAALHSAQQ